MLGLDRLGVTDAVLAGTAGNTGLGGVSVLGVGAVEPHHAGVVVIPDAQDEDHGGHGITHATEATMLRKDVLISKGGLLGRAEVGRDRVTGDAVNVGLSVGDNLAVLNVEALDLGKGATVADELGDNGHDGVGVDDLVGAVVAGVAHAVGVEVAAIGVAGSGIAGLGVGATAVITTAHGLPKVVTRMRGEGTRDAVRFPDVQLGAARSVATDTGVLVIIRRGPAFHVGLSFL